MPAPDELHIVEQKPDNSYCLARSSTVAFGTRYLLIKSALSKYVMGSLRGLISLGFLACKKAMLLSVCVKTRHIATSKITRMLPRNLNSCEPAITRITKITSFPCEGFQKSIGGLKKWCFLSLSTAKPCR